MGKNVLVYVMSVITLLMVSGCKDSDASYSGERIRTVQASFEGSKTRVGLVPGDNLLDMTTKWQDDDRIHVILMKGVDYTDIGTVPVHDISGNGKNCYFQYALPEGFDDSDGYELSCFTENCSPEIIDGDVYYNASLIRMPISQFRVRVMFNQYVEEVNSFGSFLHYGTYELLHVSNNSDKDISFSLCDFITDETWYKEVGGIRLYDSQFVVDTRFEKIIKSPAVTIPAHNSDIIVSWYIPNGRKIQNATLVAEIDGEYVYSSNTKSSDVTLCTGIAYHMYATWDGTELKFGKDEEIPAEAIDLDLPSGTLWASYNVGAKYPEDPGCFYAWGETEQKSSYSWDTYMYCDGSEATVHDIGNSIGLTNYDVAHVRWGGDWRMPSRGNFEELKRECSSEWMEVNGQWGMKFTGTNGNSIFMPAAGYCYANSKVLESTEGYYWSDTVNEDDASSSWFLRFDKDGPSNYMHYMWHCYKYIGQSVRPVQNTDKPINNGYVEGICSNYIPTDNAILESTEVYVGCEVTSPWNGEMIIEIIITDTPSMSHKIKGKRITINGRNGNVIGCSTTFDGLEANKKYYWQIAYFDWDEACFMKCSPVMSFTTGPE